MIRSKGKCPYQHQNIPDSFVHPKADYYALGVTEVFSASKQKAPRSLSNREVQRGSTVQ